MVGMTEKQWLDAQVSVLGSALIDPSTAPLVVAKTNENDYSGEYKAVFNAIASLLQEGHPIDVVAVRHKLGPAYGALLMEIMKVTPTSAHVEGYIEDCKEQSRVTELHAIGYELTSVISLNEGRDLLSKAQEVAVEHNNKRVFSMMNAMEHFYDTHHAGKKEYIEWGIGAFDDKLSTERGDVIVLAGRPSDGKSAIMLQFAYHMAQKYRVGIFSFETGFSKLTDRLVAHVSKVNFSRIKRGEMREEDWLRINSFGSCITASNLELIEAAGMTVNDILGISLAQRFDIIFIDYVQLVTPLSHRGGTRNDEVAGISTALAIMARQHKIMVVELSQLSRPKKMQSGNYPAPTMSDLRESGQLEQDADVIMMLYRTDPEKADSPRELYVVKNKEGTLGHFEILFDGKTQTFYRPTHDEIRRLANKARHEKQEQARFSELVDANEIPF